MNPTTERDILEAIGAIQHKYRRGWQIRGIPDELGETVAAHSLKVLRAAFFYYGPDKKRSRGKAVDLGMWHDFAEGLEEDYLPGEVRPEEKQRLEGEAIRTITKHSSKKGMVRRIWKEYDEQKTLEAQLVYQLDKLDPSVQALFYEENFGQIERFYRDNPGRVADLKRRYPGVPEEGLFPAMRERLEEFYPHTREQLTDPLLITAFDELMKRERNGMDPYMKYYTLLMCKGDREKYGKMAELMARKRERVQK